jgi:hypothetical protein
VTAGKSDLYGVIQGIVYEIHDDRLIVLIVRVADRKDVYR